MREAKNNKHKKDLDDEIDLRELFNIVLEEKITIISFTIFASILGVIYSLLLPDIYESKSLLIPKNSSNASGINSSYSGLAQIAGLSIPSGSKDGNALKAKKKISTLSFFENNIMPNIYLPDLMAVKYWNPETNTIVYDDGIFDTKKNTWIGNSSSKEQKLPSTQLSHLTFISDHFSLNEDKDSGSIILSIKHQSPFVAKEWNELLFNEINSFYMQEDKIAAERTISYLNEQISKTSFSEVKLVLAQLLQEEVKKLSTIQADRFYVFEYIDPPAVMEKKSEPLRALICILSALFGAMFGMVLVFVRLFISGKKA